MKKWFASRSEKTKVMLALVATFVSFGVLGSLTVPKQHDAAVSGSTVNTAAVAPIEVSEKPKIAVTKTEVESVEEEVPFTTTTTYDGTLPKDTTVVRVEGTKGKKVVRTEVKTKDGVEVSRSLIGETIAVPPVTKIVAIGTKIVTQPKKNAGTECDPHYVECIRNTNKDLECKDLDFQVHIVTRGEDPHNFDADENGLGCENNPSRD